MVNVCKKKIICDFYKFKTKAVVFSLKEGILGVLKSFVILLFAEKNVNSTFVCI